ncbi:MAG: hypothetical protein LBD84_00990 [Campylobacteraceae bacterium]|nr:hypothetical protein [Campylobacteraceae bacterium]
MNEIAKLPNQQVIKYGDAVGTHGSDIISVNTKTGEVTLWDSKYRSSTTAMQSSSTFTNPSAFNKAIRDAIKIIDKDTTLPANIKEQALKNLEKRNIITNTVGHGGAKNSVTVKLCNGKPCN